MKEKDVSKKYIKKISNSQRKYYKTVFHEEFLRILDDMKTRIMENPNDKKLHEKLLSSFENALQNVMQSEKSKKMNSQVIIATCADSLVQNMVSCDFKTSIIKPKKNLRTNTKKKNDEKQIVGYKIVPGFDTIPNSPLGELTEDVCLRCVQLSDRKKYEITRTDVNERSTVCDRCFRELSSGKLNTELYEQVQRKDLVAFYHKDKKQRKAHNN